MLTGVKLAPVAENRRSRKAGKGDGGGAVDNDVTDVEAAPIGVEKDVVSSIWSCIEVLKKVRLET